MPVASDRLTSLQNLKLLQAVRSNDTDLVERLIASGVPDLINVSDPEDEETGLHIAAAVNNEAMLGFLLKKGASATVKDKLGRTPAMRAAEYGHIQSLVVLIESSETIDLSARDNEGQNILHYCLCPTKRHQQCLDLAIKNGASVNNVGRDGKTLVAKVCLENLSSCLNSMLLAGMDPNIQIQETGESGLHISCALGSEECVRALVKGGADVNLVDEKGYTPAHCAAQCGHLNLLRILSGYQADFTILNKEKVSPLHLAAENGHGPICKFLPQRGCLATLKDIDGATARSLAKDAGHKDAMKECRKAEKIKTGKPGTQLWAVKFYDWMLENLTEIQTDITEFDMGVEDDKKMGSVPLSDFVSILTSLGAPLEEAQLESIAKMHDSKKLDLVDYEVFFTGKKFVNKLYLVGAGKKKKGGKSAKRGKKGKAKKTKVDQPICLNPDADLIEDCKLINYIEKCTLQTDNTRFHRDRPPEHPCQDDSVWYSNRPEAVYIHMNEAIKYNDLESIKSALRQGYLIDQMDRYYKTPLMLACLEGNIDTVKFLVEQGATINAQDNFKWTPLHFACHLGQIEIVQYLISLGAHLNAQSLNGGTPIMRAIESSREDVVAYLISLRADIRLENKKGQTAVDIAKAYADPRIIPMVTAYLDSLPAEKKKGAPGGKKSAKSRAGGSPTRGDSAMMRPTSGAAQQSPGNDPPAQKERRPSILRAASALADGRPMKDTAVFNPINTWVPQPTTDELKQEKQKQRDRFGEGVDFPDFLPPFQKSIADKAAAIEAQEDD